MNPSEVRSRLNDYLEGDLPAAECSQVERVLAAHPELRAELAELRATVALLHHLPEPELPPYLADRVIARVRAGEAEPETFWRRLLRLTEPRIGVPLAAGLAGLAAFTLAQRGVLPPVEDLSPPPAVVVAELTEPAAFADAPIPNEQAGGEVALPHAWASIELPLPRGIPMPTDLVAATNAAAARAALDRRRELLHRMPIAQGRPTLAVGLARQGPPERYARMLRGAGHPHAASLASHFDEAAHAEVAFADFSPGRLRR